MTTHTTCTPHDASTAPELVQPTRPIINYHGGKWRLAPWILEHMPPHRIYVEPYGGAGSVLMRKTRSMVEVYNDLDGEVVNLFRVLRDPAQARELERALRLTPFSRREFLDAYAPADEPVERARRLVARSLMGFGSASHNPCFKTSFRANSRTKRMGYAGEWITYPDNMLLVTERLQGVVVEERPALEVIRRHDSPETLFYVDPPYPKETRHRGLKTACYMHEMEEEDHIALAETLRQTQGMALVSCYRTPLYDTLFRGWTCVTRDAFADGARRRTEVLWLSPRLVSALHAMGVSPDAKAADGQDVVAADGQDAVAADGQDAVAADGQDAVAADGQDAVSGGGEAT